jgi:hypothetical protein
VDDFRFDIFARSLARSRRSFLGGTLAIALGLLEEEAVDAKRKRKRNRKNRAPLPPFNQFGCLDVGQPCRGDGGNCCSGVCEGARPKPGKRDASRCAAHDASTCLAGNRPQDVCGGAKDVDCVTSIGNPGGQCYTTTGNAAYCARESYCRACQRDADCQPFCGAAAACVVCDGCPDGGTACASPDLGLCVFPK